jgi:anti-sigma regulatory factor (Ser/Thr protein kinase)
LDARPFRKLWDVERSNRASGEARDLISAALDSLAPPATVADAALLTSELVSNVMRHTTGSCALALTFDPAGAHIEVGVTDSSPGTYALVAGRLPQTIGGFGLRLVDQLATDWGSTRRSDSKTVWFRLAAHAIT